MRKLLILFLLLLTCWSFAQQKETFDVATYSIPQGWKKVSSNADVTAFAITDNQKGTYGQIAIYSTTISKGNLEADFRREWEALILKPYKPTDEPTRVATESANGWDGTAGTAPFEFSGSRAVAVLVTMTGQGRCMSIVIVTNTTDYQSTIEDFLESVELQPLQTATQPAPPVFGQNVDSPILGTWSKVASSNQSYSDYTRPYSDNNNGYQQDQYTFNADGTYFYASKTFRMTFDKILLVRENGTYQISGNRIIVNPQESVIEAWSKKDNIDKWGTLQTSQGRTLEKVTYTFTKHYFSGIQQWNLVLQADKQTKRDGAFTSNGTFTNAWFLKPISDNNPAIDLPGEQITQPPVRLEGTPAGTYQFSTSNFDDGWTSTVQEDWVEVTNGKLRVLIHYPNERTDAYNTDLLDKLKNSWDLLIAPKYRSASNLEFRPVKDWQSVEFAEANAIETRTGKSMYVVLFRFKGSNGVGSYMEFITPDKNTFEQAFGVYHATTSGWEKMENMEGYNKFAVAESDLTGTWSNKFSGSLHYVNTNTGAFAGMSSHASNEKFEFGPGTTYRWSLGFASGQVGNLKTQSAKSNGTFSLPNNWQVNFSDIEGKPKTFNAHFSCVKGSRVLWLGHTGYGRID